MCVRKYRKLMKLQLQTYLPITLTFFATLLPISKAQAQTTSASQLAEICVLNAEGTGQYKIKLDSLFVQTLTRARPSRFATVDPQEHCDDNKDNDCDGQINEGCVSDPEPSFDSACDTCMQSKCADFATSCIADQACRAATNCVIQHRCLDQNVGHLACICGEDVSVAQCMRDTDKGRLRGACADEFYDTDALAPSNEDGKKLAGQTFTCMLRQCKDSCSNKFYNHNPQT